MDPFIETQPTLENYWRAIILFGRNVASYKFSLGKSLLEFAQQGKEIVTFGAVADDFYIILEGSVSVWIPVHPEDMAKPLLKFKQRVKSAILSSKESDKINFAKEKKIYFIK